MVLLTGLALQVGAQTASDDVIQGGQGNDLIQLLNGHDQGSGGDGDDLIFGDAGGDILFGESGADILVGAGILSNVDTHGNSLIGGAGDDHLIGGSFGDIYEYSIGDGFDLISEFGAGAAGSDQVMFGAGMAAESFSFGRERGDLFVEYLGQDILRVRSWFGSAAGEWRIEEFVFDEGPPLAGSALAFDGTSWTGTASANTFTASTSGPHWILGLEGNDNLTGATGADVIVGGTGNDTVSGGDGADGLYGDDGVDTLNGGNGDDDLYGGPGTDTLNGHAGNDVLEGGAGNDTLSGSTGNDVYRWRHGDGDDQVYDLVSEYVAGTENQLVLAPGIGPADITMTATSTALKFIIKDPTGTPAGSVNINSWYSVATGSIRHRDTWVIKLSDGTVWIGKTIATPGVDTLNGTSDSDDFHGGPGNDSLSGNDGDDLLFGEEDSDTLTGGNGDDQLWGGPGADTLNGNAGADLLVGGSGNDALSGAAGNDAYQWDIGDGDDQIYDLVSEYAPGTENRLVFGPGVSPADIEMTATASALKLIVKDGGGLPAGSVNINYWYHVASGTVRHRDTWFIEFADGTVWVGKTLATPGIDILSGSAGSDTLNGGPANDTLTGNGGDDSLSGDEGADVLNGNDGDDLLAGGLGSDTVFGGNGSDRYVWMLGDGDDYFSDSYTDLSTPNTLVLRGGMTAGDLDFLRNGSYQLQLSVTDAVNPSVSLITIEHWARLYNGAFHFGDWYLDLENCGVFRFRNLPTTGNDSETGSSEADLILGLAGDDLLKGGEGSDLIHGGAGVDSLVGEAGDDILVGGKGNDVLVGGSGSDQYSFKAGDGYDEVVESEVHEEGEENVAVLGAGVDPQAVVITRLGDDMRVSYGPGDAITFRDWFGGGEAEAMIAYVRFGGGTLWNSDYLEGLIGATGSGGDGPPPLLQLDDVNAALSASPAYFSGQLEVHTPLR